MYDMNAMPNLLMHMQNAVPQIAYPTVDQFFVPPVDFQLFNDAQQFQLFNDAQYFQPVDYLPQFIPTPIMNFPDFMLTQPPMILDSIPNLRGIQMDLPTEYMDFVDKFNSIMQILDFPVVQPKITREQLKERIKNMSRSKLEAIKVEVLAAAKLIPKVEAFLPAVKKAITILFVIIPVVIQTIAAAFSISDHFNESDNGTDIFVNGSHNNVVVNVYNGSGTDVNYYFENEQAQEDTELDTPKEQSSSTTVIIPNTNRNTN